MSKLRRFQIIKHWIAGKRNDVSFSELIKQAFDLPCEVKGKAVIRAIRRCNGYLEIYFRDILIPFFYPVEIPIYFLYQVLKESFYPADWNYYEIEQTKVDKNDVVIDCGAAEGLFSFLIAHRCRTVYAIEPMPRFVESMRRTFAGFSNTEIIPCALSDKPGTGAMTDNGIMSTLENRGVQTIAVSVDTVDHLFYERGIKVSYIKADLEGHEQKMLKGAYNTIKMFGPKLAITTYHKAEDAEWISCYLRDVNPRYKIKLKGIEGGSGAPVMLHAWID